MSTKFNSLTLLAAQITRMGFDNGFDVNVDVNVPDGFETSCMVLEGILQELHGVTVEQYFGASQRRALRDALLDVAPTALVSDVLFDNPGLCLGMFEGRAACRFSTAQKATARYFHEIGENAFEGAIAESVGMC